MMARSNAGPVTAPVRPVTVRLRLTVSRVQEDPFFHLVAPVRLIVQIISLFLVIVAYLVILLAMDAMGRRETVARASLRSSWMTANVVCNALVVSIKIARHKLVRHAMKFARLARVVVWQIVWSALSVH